MTSPTPSQQEPLAGSSNLPPSASGPSYSTTEVARLLNVSTQTVQKWVDLGHLLAWKTLGGHRRISAESVNVFVAGQTIPATTPKPPVPNKTSKGGGLEVLVVDDDASQIELLEATLTRQYPQLTLLVANDGFNALLQVGQRLPDLLITDVVMNGMDGIEMLRSLRNNAHSAGLPAIAISNYSADEIRFRGGLPEGVEFLAKPVDRVRLYEIIDKILQQQAAIP